MVDYARLRAELLGTEPGSLGYTGLSDQAAADKLNATNTGRTLPRAVIPTWEMREAIVQSEYAAATAANRQWLDMILAGENVTAAPGNIRTGLLAIFAAGSTTRANLAALQTRTVSRAEELGLGVVAPGDVELARTKSGGW
jgi:hypothetical protein